MREISKKIADSFNSQGMMKTLGAKLALVTEGEVHVALPFSNHLSLQHGFLHSGAITSIADSACCYAALTTAPQDCEVITAELKMNLLEPALGEHFLAIGKVQDAGELLTVCTGEVRAFLGKDSSYKVVALMQATITHSRKNSI